jgi:hypothetical protein
MIGGFLGGLAAAFGINVNKSYQNIKNETIVNKMTKNVTDNMFKVSTKFISNCNTTVGGQNHIKLNIGTIGGNLNFNTTQAITDFTNTKCFQQQTFTNEMATQIINQMSDNILSQMDNDTKQKLLTETKAEAQANPSILPAVGLSASIGITSSRTDIQNTSITNINTEIQNIVKKIVETEFENNCSAKKINNNTIEITVNNVGGDVNFNVIQQIVVAGLLECVNVNGMMNKIFDKFESQFELDLSHITNTTATTESTSKVDAKTKTGFSIGAIIAIVIAAIVIAAVLGIVGVFVSKNMQQNNPQGMRPGMPPSMPFGAQGMRPNMPPNVPFNAQKMQPNMPPMPPSGFPMKR